MRMSIVRGEMCDLLEDSDEFSETVPDERYKWEREWRQISCVCMCRSMRSCKPVSGVRVFVRSTYENIVAFRDKTINIGSLLGSKSFRSF